MTMVEQPSLFPTIWPDDAARTRLGDPVTSHEAADRSAVTRVDSQAWVAHVLASRGLMTQPELIAYARTHNVCLSDSRIRSAVHELVENGSVEFSGLYRLTDSGNRAQVWQMVSGDAA